VGAPFFTTDSGAALRAAEMGCEALFKGTSVDGVYTADPKKDPTATRYDTLSFQEALQQGIRIADATAFALCMENDLPLVVFGADDEGAILRIVQGEKIGTLVSSEA
jgi:uridylate kinase